MLTELQVKLLEIFDPANKAAPKKVPKNDAFRFGSPLADPLDWGVPEEEQS
jgi:hypothetical protein